ncbi:MAG: hypothetical protein QGH14_02000, partial [Candidatus Bathyarchaeota archaeon]|nr:hypothetical protein [Candidatus Bathyarchaeota archaeon]
RRGAFLLVCPQIVKSFFHCILKISPRINLGINRSVAQKYGPRDKSAFGFARLGVTLFDLAKRLLKRLGTVEAGVSISSRKRRLYGGGQA